MEKWAHEIIVGFIAALGFAAIWGTLRATVRNQGEWLKSLSAENSATHKDLYQHIEAERRDRTDAFLRQAESVQMHYVSRRECQVMHAKHGTNGGSVHATKES